MTISEKTTTCSIDLSGPRSGFAISSGGKIIDAARFEIAPRNNSVFLRLFFDSLKKTGLAPSSIDKWIVGIGPGSFTGLRIAAAFVSGMSHDNKAELSGMPTAFPIAAEALNGASGKAIVLFYAALDSLIYCEVSAINNTYSLDKIQIAKADNIGFINESDVVALMKNQHIIDICEKNNINLKKAVILETFPCEKMLEIKMSKEYSILDPLYVRPAAAVAV